TGKPKGVMIEHSGVVDYIWWAAATYVKNEKLNFPLYTSITFDLTVTSLFTPLLTGNAVVVYGDEDNPLILTKIIEENKIGVLKLTPAHLKLLRDLKIEHKNSTIRRIIVGGEELESALAEEIYHAFGTGIEIYNEYGPTETVVGSTIYKYDPLDKTRTVPIGKPTANTHIYILDNHQKNVPLGVTGEIYIGGDGVGRGYLNQPELTSEKFVPLSLPNNQSLITNNYLYRTGDLARWHPDGNIEYLGRIDHQVKIRGFRIELGEIEARLANHPGIKEAVVLVKKDNAGEKLLNAYYTAATGDTQNTPAPREYLNQYLPGYMIPSYFIRLEKIPLTPNGKIDRKTLTRLDNPGKTQRETIAPRNPPEEKLAAIWADVLNIKKILVGIDDNFFQSGGHSLRATVMAGRIHKKFNARISLTEIFKTPTIRELIKKIT
ncbi:MAG: AMP-binding protein, partial [bacterium]|nr:AMP-binding protein [bacterium]